jgi:aryl-alcohol dehydrogenase-like predicted oxidoreductase
VKSDRSAVTRRDFIRKVTATALGTEALLAAAARSQTPDPTSMGYRMLGQTGISVSELGFGSHVNRRNMDDPETRAGQIRRGLELGINLFDIYDHSYHQFELMSEVLEPVRQDVVISLVTVGPASLVMREIEFALETFKTDTIDLFRAFVWDTVNLNDLEMRIETLQQARAQGKVRAIGLTAHDQSFLIQMLRAHPELDYLFFPYNFRHQAFAPVTSVHASSWGQVKADGLLPASPKATQNIDCTQFPCPDPEFAELVRQTGVGLIAIKPFGGGGLLDLAPDDPLLDALQDRGASLPQAALRFVLGAGEIASTIPAMNSIQEVEENFGATQGDGMSKAELQLLKIYFDAAEQSGGAYLPEKYRWLEKWKA